LAEKTKKPRKAIINVKIFFIFPYFFSKSKKTVLYKRLLMNQNYQQTLFHYLIKLKEGLPD